MMEFRFQQYHKCQDLCRHVFNFISIFCHEISDLYMELKNLNKTFCLVFLDKIL